MRRYRRMLIAVMPMALLWGCTTGADIQPAPAAREAAGVPDGAVAAAGVRLVASVPDWPGQHPIRSEVLPMRLVMENRGDRPVALRYANLDLVLPDGATYSALPLYRIEGEVQETVRRYGPINDPGFVGDRFAVAPYMRGVYPGYPVAGPWGYDYRYYGTYQTYFADIVDIPLPTDAMRRLALPEGVIAPGGRVEGWVYFEELPEGATRATLRADLEDSRTSRSFAELRIPFVVQE